MITVTLFIDEARAAEVFDQENRTDLRTKREALKQDAEYEVRQAVDEALNDAREQQMERTIR